MSIKNLVVLAATITPFLVSLPGHATVVEFESLPAGSCAGLGTSPLTLNGFTFTINNANRWFQCNPGVIAQNTSKAIVSANDILDWTLTDAGSGTFSLQGFDAGSDIGSMSRFIH